MKNLTRPFLYIRILLVWNALLNFLTNIDCLLILRALILFKRKMIGKMQ